ncbi:MAG: aryl-sulfate sulfotransferase [Cytophagales bacterium]|nr:aryl-sulfate sulfotransferase [Cytophagales bacterium]
MNSIRINRALIVGLILLMVATIFIGWRLFFACKYQIVDDSLSVKLDPGNSLRVHIEFQTDQETDATVKYWKKEDAYEPAKCSKRSISSQCHQFTIVDLEQDCEYKFEILLGSNACAHPDAAYRFTTGKIPVGLTPINWRDGLEQNFQGYILLQRRTVKGNVFIVGSAGKIVWYEKIDGMVKVSNWTDDNTILVLYGDKNHKNSAGDHILEIDLEGNRLIHLTVGENDFNNTAHHEVLKDGNGNVLALIYDTRHFNLTDYGGSANDEVIGDGLLLMDKYGNQLWKWSVFDSKNPLEDPLIYEKKGDWGHANGVYIDLDGNYLVSFRDWNQIWKINSTSGQVMWTFGENGDIPLEDKYQFSGQHSIHINKNGEYMLFDNGLKNRKSRALAYIINEESFEAVNTLNIAFQEELFADRMGSAYLLDNDRILLCSPRLQSLVITDLNGDIISHADLGKPDPYRANYIRTLYNQEFLP